MKFITKIEEKEKSVILINVSLSFSEIERNKKKVIKNLAENIKIEGFRKGKTPLDIVETKIGLDKILQEASQETINEVFPEILEKEKLQIIGYPSITVTKLAPSNDFEFNIEMTVYPKVTLPDYNKIAKNLKKEEKKITGKEVKKIEQNLIVMQNKMFHQNHKHKDNEKCEHKEIKELTDDFVKKIGPFKDVVEFKKKIKRDLEKEAQNHSVLEHRGKIAESILKELEMEIPEILINAELEKIVAQLKDDIQKQGQDYQEYLKSQNKNEVELKESFKEEGKKRAKIEIILKEIAKKEKIEVDSKKMEEQVDMISKNYQKEDIKNIELYVRNIMINEAVMTYLEKLSDK